MHVQLCIQNKCLSWCFDNKYTWIGSMYMYSHYSLTDIQTSIQQLLRVKNPDLECTTCITNSEQFTSKIFGVTRETSMSNIIASNLLAKHFLQCLMPNSSIYLPQKNWAESTRVHFGQWFYKCTWRSSVGLYQKLWNICSSYEKTLPKHGPYI